MDLSVVFATFKSEAILEKSLTAYCEINTAYKWELIIVDNACREETLSLVDKYKDKLPIVFLKQPKPGKNNALNMALPLIKGDLVMFTDNDIIPPKDIIDVYVEAANEYPDFSIFSGKILPDIVLPDWIDQNFHRVRSALGICEKGDTTQSIPVVDVWGGNMMLRRSIFSHGFTFNVAVGPSGANYIMGSETELLLRLKAAGYKALYVTNSKVFHQIRMEQLSLSWLKSRAFRSGKGAAFNNEDDSIKIVGVPRYLFKKIVCDVFTLLPSVIKGNKKQINTRTMELYYCWGMIYQNYKKSKC